MCLCLFSLALPFFLFHIEHPAFLVGEEFHYVNAARLVREAGVDKNLEHPPLAKQLIAVGLSLFGDEPLGWRIMSAIFGALTVVAMYLWGLALFRVRSMATWSVFFSVANLMLWSQAHFATLEIFQFAFSALGCATFTEAWLGDVGRRKRRWLLAIAGVLLGLGVACKWSVLIPWAGCLGMAFILCFRTSIWRMRDVVLALIIVPFLCYLMPYTNYILHQGFGRWCGLQYAMWLDQTLAEVSPTKAFMAWYEWPLAWRPQILLTEVTPAPELSVRTMLLIGNPVVMWGGVLAAGWAAYEAARSWLKNKSLLRIEGALIVMIFLVFYLPWAVIPHRLQYYYYYFPAGMTLSFALTWAIGKFDGLKQKRRYKIAAVVICGGSFLYYFPLIAGVEVRAPWSQLWQWIYDQVGVALNGSGF